MVKVELVEVTAPAAWAAYLVNGDATIFDYSQDAEDEAACYAMEEELGRCVDVSEPEFMSRPDYGMAGDCCTYTFQK